MNVTISWLWLNVRKIKIVMVPQIFNLRIWRKKRVVKMMGLFKC